MSRKAVQRPRRKPRWLPIASLSVVIPLAAVAWILTRPGPSEPAAWSRLGTQDVHSLAFVGDDPNHLLFGHHNGIAETQDGGKTWMNLPVGEDAMGMAAAGDGSIVIAGHLVFTVSQDGGKTWTAIASDLPNLDIHGFARDPADPTRMWAYLATGGLWASTDSGAHWSQVRQDNVIFPVAVTDGSTTRLIGVDVNGLTGSIDGGKTWTTLGMPPGVPVTSLVATPEGRTVYIGSGDGVFRSDDGGDTWAATAFTGQPFALATTPDGKSVALVTRETEFYRSSDSGVTWPGPD